jgi:hypothetical protein
MSEGAGNGPSQGPGGVRHSGRRARSTELEVNRARADRGRRPGSVCARRRCATTRTAGSSHSRPPGREALVRPRAAASGRVRPDRAGARDESRAAWRDARGGRGSMAASSPSRSPRWTRRSSELVWLAPRWCTRWSARPRVPIGRLQAAHARTGPTAAGGARLVAAGVRLDVNCHLGGRPRRSARQGRAQHGLEVQQGRAMDGLATADPRTRHPSTARTRTRCNPIGFGRSAERVAKTPASGRAGSSRGWTTRTSRRARCSHVRMTTSAPRSNPCTAAASSGRTITHASGAPSSPCLGAAATSVSGDSIHPTGRTLYPPTLALLIAVTEPPEPQAPACPGSPIIPRRRPSTFRAGLQLTRIIPRGG